MHLLRIESAKEFVAIVEQFIHENETGYCSIDVSLEIIGEMCRQTDVAIIAEALMILKGKLDTALAESTHINRVSPINMNLFDKEDEYIA